MYPMNNMYSPYQNQNVNSYTPYSFSSPQSLTRVTGIEGAKAYQMGANSTVALFDNNEDLMYIKTTDGAGFPTIRTFRFEEITFNEPKSSNNYVSREEMEEYVQQFIQQSITATEQNVTTNAISKQLKAGKSRSDLSTDV